MTHIINKKYEHYNHAMGKYITSKKHYKDEMKRQGLIPADQANEIAKNAVKKKDFKPSDETMRFLHQVKGSADKDGKVKLGSRAIDFMKKKGVNFKMPDIRELEGGFKN